MASPNPPSASNLKRSRDSLKCDCCRNKKRKCFPHDRDWTQGEKCEPCRLGGQDCGPDVPHPRNADAGAALPHVLELAPLLPRIPNTDPHPTSRNTEADQDLLVINGVPTAEGSSATRPGPDSQSQIVDSESITEKVVLPSSRLSSNSQRSEDCDDAPKYFTRLCDLRIILEDLRALQSPNLPPSGIRQAIEIETGLNYTVSQTTRAFKKTLGKLLTIAENENTTNAKLIYLQAVGVIEAVDGDRGEFSTVRADVLYRLISIYEKEENWGAAYGQLQKLASVQRHGRTGSVPDACSKLAECSQKISAKIGRVLDAINITIEGPLHVNRETPFPSLHRALWGGHDKVTTILCRTPTTLEGLDMRRQNALMVAAAIGKLHLLDPAFRYNPNLLTDLDALQRHALFHAAQNGDYGQFLTLVQAGANFTDRDGSGRSILRVAAAAGSASIVEYLLLQGISPNDDFLRESSALHDASGRGRWTVCKLLLSKGALANDRLPADGFPGVYKTPSEVAKDKGFPDLASMLEEAALRPMNDITHPMNDITHPMNDIMHPMNDITHPMNDITHPMNDTVHQDYSQVHEPYHVDKIQSTHTASATHAHDEPGNAPGNAPITSAQPQPGTQQRAQVDQRTLSDHGNDWLNDLNLPSPTPYPSDGFFNPLYAMSPPFNASANFPLQNFDDQQ